MKNGAAVWEIDEMSLCGWVAWTNLFVRGGFSLVFSYSLKDEMRK